MQLVLTEDQELVAKTAADFFAERSPLSRLRALRDAGDATGFSRSLWKEMAELGWLGIPYPESAGGADLGLAELCLVLEAGGRKLAPEPFLSTVLLAGQALRFAGSEAQQSQWLPRICAGDAILALAHAEKGSGYGIASVAARAEATADGYRLSGAKTQVLDGGVADALVVSARTSGSAGEPDGVTLFLVPGDAAGLAREPQVRVDSRAAAIVTLDGVAVPASAVVGGPGEGADLLERVIDFATVGLSAEMLGGMSQAFELTLDYMKEREQFDARIGSFQALQHRAARVFMEIELCRSAVMAAARAVDEGSDDAAKLVSLAKARCSDAYVLAANEGVQIFAGVGMTDEYDIGLYLKRARAAQLTFGDAAWHRDRWARLSGY